MYMKYLYIFRTPKPAISQMGGIGVSVTNTLISLPPTSGFSPFFHCAEPRRTAFIVPGRVVSRESIEHNAGTRNILKVHTEPPNQIRRETPAVQPADIGWPTGNGKKLRCTQAQLGQATCLGAA